MREPCKRRDQVLGRESLDCVGAWRFVLHTTLFIRERVRKTGDLKFELGVFSGLPTCLTELLGAAWGEVPREINSPEQPPKFRADLSRILIFLHPSRGKFAPLVCHCVCDSLKGAAAYLPAVFCWSKLIPLRTIAPPILSDITSTH